MQYFIKYMHQCAACAVGVVGVSLLAASRRGDTPFFEGVAVMSFTLKIFSDFGCLMVMPWLLTIGVKLTKPWSFAVKIYKMQSMFV